MFYKYYYNSPIGRITLLSDGKYLLGLWFDTASYYPKDVINTAIEDRALAVFNLTDKWLDNYFKGKSPDGIEIPLRLNGTEFRMLVWDELKKIPYGKTVSYSDIAKITALKMGKKIMSSQAVGGAVGHNPVSIIVPCHRVIGTNGALVGYDSGIDIKQWLLDHEKKFNQY